MEAPENLLQSQARSFQLTQRDAGFALGLRTIRRLLLRNPVHSGNRRDGSQRRQGRQNRRERIGSNTCVAVGLGRCRHENRRGCWLIVSAVLEDLYMAHRRLESRWSRLGRRQVSTQIEEMIWPRLGRVVPPTVQSPAARGRAREVETIVNTREPSARCSSFHWSSCRCAPDGSRASPAWSHSQPRPAYASSS